MQITEEMMKTIENSASLLKALSHPVRLLILGILNCTECNVTHLEKEAGLSQSGVSQHLRILRLSGIIEPHREGKEICYKIIDPKALEILRVMDIDCKKKMI